METESKLTESKIQEIANSLYKLEIIAKEIIDFTKADESEVWRRLCLEIEKPGYNVSLRAKEYNVTPHKFNNSMIKFYEESDGFIYETLIESRSPNRANKWLNIVRFILSTTKSFTSSTKILMYGDSVGSDSIFLKKLGFDVYYHDFDSYCSEFADYRFQKRGLEIKKFSDCAVKEFDFVICLEVAEHSPDPVDLIQKLSILTSEVGYCIFSEAFWLLTPDFPTHLKSNEKYVGKIDDLFKEVGMNVVWRDVDDKPIIYSKHIRNSVQNHSVSAIIKAFVTTARKTLKRDEL